MPNKDDLNYCPKLNPKINPEVCKIAKVALCGHNDVICCLDCGYKQNCNRVCWIARDGFMS